MATAQFNYLQNGKSSFYFRRSIPEGLRPFLGQREFFWSLSTTTLGIGQWRCLQSAAFTTGLLEFCSPLPQFASQAGVRELIKIHKDRIRSQLPLLHSGQSPTISSPWLNLFDGTSHLEALLY